MDMADRDTLRVAPIVRRPILVHWIAHLSGTGDRLESGLMPTLTQIPRGRESRSAIHPRLPSRRCPRILLIREHHVESIVLLCHDRRSRQEPTEPDFPHDGCHREGTEIPQQHEPKEMGPFRG